MTEYGDNYYKADKGKHFVLTEAGKQEVINYKDKIVGEPVSEYDTEAPKWAVEKGYEKEVPIPDWIRKGGFQVVYDYNGHTLTAGNPIVFPEREIAEKYLKNYQQKPWMKHNLYILPTIFEGRSLKDCRMYEGKKVYNRSWYYGADALEVGDLVEAEIVDDLINCMPPAASRRDCAQLGEPASHKIDNDGRYRPTYETFKQLDKSTWEYCGDCFRGENVQNGTIPQYV